MHAQKAQCECVFYRSAQEALGNLGIPEDSLLRREGKDNLVFFRCNLKRISQLYLPPFSTSLPTPSLLLDMAPPCLLCWYFSRLSTARTPRG